jgi:hypothetical protein
MEIIRKVEYCTISLYKKKKYHMVTLNIRSTDIKANTCFTHNKQDLSNPVKKVVKCSSNEVWKSQTGMSAR